MGQAGSQALRTPSPNTEGPVTAGTPTPILTTLLCLGLCEGPGDQDQAGRPPKPSIWVTPDPWVPKGGSVTIWCQGPPQAAEYHLYKKESSELHTMEVSLDPSGPASFSIARMNKASAGSYQCTYRGPGHWSEHSDPLALVVTGEFDAPKLSAQPGSSVPVGANVTLACNSIYKSGTFHLLMEQGTGPLQDLGPPVSQGGGLALFPLGPVGASHQGTYRCYRNPSFFPYQWSQPSEGLQLRVIDSAPQDYTMGNLIRAGVAASILLVLALLLCDACHSKPRRRRHQQDSNTVEMMRLEEAWGPRRPPEHGTPSPGGLERLGNVTPFQETCLRSPRAAEPLCPSGTH